MTKESPSPPRTPRSDKDMQDASDALHYEIWMFNEMVKTLSTQPGYPGNPKYNALVESFVQHTRNLIEFFYPPGNVHSDTIIATHFFSEKTQWKKDIPKWLDDVRIKANKLLAHLTYDRVTEYKDDKGWEYDKIIEISEHLNSLFAEFLKKVPQEQIGEKLKNYKSPTCRH